MPVRSEVSCAIALTLCLQLGCHHRRMESLGMSSTKTTSTQSRELIQRLAEAMNSAQASYEVWYTLAGKDKGYEQYSAVLRDSQFRDFFESVLNANFKVMFIDISCLFDSDKRASSFHQLKTSLKKDGYDDFRDRIESEMSSHEKLIKKIKANRDKRIAHHDATPTEENMLKEYGVTPNEIRWLLETFNGLLIAIYKDVVSLNTAYPIARIDRFEDATFQLLLALKRARENQKI